MRRRAWMLIPLGVLLVFGAQAEGPPPQDLHLVDDHWTAWDPPASFPEGTPVHIIERGDTLWSLATRFYGDGYLWPQLWEENRYILDAHWIYPGDPLAIPGAARLEEPVGAEGVAAAPIDSEVAETLPAEDVQEDPFAGILADRDREPSTVGGPGGSRADVPVPLGHESDIYCTGYVGEMDENLPYQIVGSEYEFLTPALDPQQQTDLKGTFGKADTEKYGLGLGDIVYLDSGRASGLSAGELLSAVAPRAKVSHPLNGDTLGRLYAYLGRVRVLSVQEDSIKRKPLTDN